MKKRQAEGMSRVSNARVARHPVLSVPERKEITFYFNDASFTSYEGEVISSALFANGVSIFGHHYLDSSPQGIFCANGQCSQCLVIADGRAVKACMEPVKEGQRVYPCDALPLLAPEDDSPPGFGAIQTLDCDVLVVGGGPAGIAAAIELGKLGHRVILVDDKDRLGGKLVLQTHKFFGSIEDCYAGTRGIEIARILKSQLDRLDNVRVFLNAAASGVFADRKVGVLQGKSYFLVRPRKFLVAAGARERALSFPGADLPGVYGAGAFQTLLNRDLVAPSSRLFVVGGGNVGLIAAYHAIQAGITVAGLAEALPEVSGYKVHADKIIRLGVPLYLSHSVVRADGDDGGISSVTIAQVDGAFKPLPGMEKRLDVDTVLIAVGLTPVSEMYDLARNVGLDAYSAGDAFEIAEASAAMFSGRIAGLTIARDLGDDVDIPPQWHEKAEILKSRPGKTVPVKYPEKKEGIFPVFHCSQEIPCNPCISVCPQEGITIDGDSLMGLPRFEGTCTGCSKCVLICPGLAVTLVDFRKEDPGFASVTVPLELLPDGFREGDTIPALDGEGNFLADGVILKVGRQGAADRTLLLKIRVPAPVAARVAGVKVQKPEDTACKDAQTSGEEGNIITCRCMRVSDGEIRALIRRGVRDMNQIKAMLNAGMGACGGRTCRQLIERIFREEGVPASEVTTLTCRPPEMEIPLGVFAGI
jgi:NADPH-dependent 2,4-dienoyl-CoA reductase/sulfur reductase-like enzyme/NAD-dependent dihydropyrimidine dehydrogenase PreA subunit/bacterioferritin-associated ferredoxin